MSIEKAEFLGTPPVFKIPTLSDIYESDINRGRIHIIEKKPRVLSLDELKTSLFNYRGGYWKDRVLACHDNADDLMEVLFEYAEIAGKAFTTMISRDNTYGVTILKELTRISRSMAHNTNNVLLEGYNLHPDWLGRVLVEVAKDEERNDKTVKSKLVNGITESLTIAFKTVAVAVGWDPRVITHPKTNRVTTLLKYKGYSSYEKISGTDDMLPIDITFILIPIPGVMVAGSCIVDRNGYAWEYTGPDSDDPLSVVVIREEPGINGDYAERLVPLTEIESDWKLAPPHVSSLYITE